MCDLSSLLFIGDGIFLTLFLLIGGIFLGAVLGAILVATSYIRSTKYVTKILISLIRGTPALLQLSLIYFLLPRVLGIRVDLVTAGILAFGINSSAYIAEIYRAGIESVPVVQREAAAALGIGQFYIWWGIVAPQAFRVMLPAIINEMITLTKETSLISTIGGLDIMRRAHMIGAQHFTYFGPLMMAAFYYYLLTRAWEYVGKWIEKKIQW